MHSNRCLSAALYPEIVFQVFCFNILHRVAPPVKTGMLYNLLIFFICIQVSGMDVRDFYGRKKTVCRVTTVAEALNAASSVSNPVAIVVLPPQDGDRPIDSDSEDVPDDIQNEMAFETAGELEVEAEAECSDNDSDLEEQPAQKKKRGTGSRTKGWKKAISLIPIFILK